MTRSVGNLDLLIESAAVHGQIAAGVSPALVAARSTLGARGVAVFAGKNGQGKRNTKSPKWSPGEDTFLKSCLGVLPEEDIAESLGRSVVAVHLRWKRDLGLCSPSKRQNIMTCNQIANGVGKDAKCVAALIDRGILQGYRLPFKDVTRVVDRTTLLGFLVNPMNWVYFDPKRVGSRPRASRGVQSYAAEFWAHARRLVRKQQRRWKDKWWRIGKVAHYHGVSQQAVNKAIRTGRLKAIDWGNWWVLKSHATNPSLSIQRWTGKGGKGYDHISLSPSAVGFLILAEAVGLMHSEIAALTKWKEKRVTYILQKMRRQGRIPIIIKENNLRVFYDAKTGETYASWKVHQNRFPRLARLMRSLKKRPSPANWEARHINRIKRKAKRYAEKSKK